MLPKKHTFAFRLNLYVVSSISLIALIIFTSYYLISRNLFLEGAEQNAKNITEKYVNQIDAVIGRVAKIPLNFASVIESNLLNEHQLTLMLQNIVANNNEVFGSAIAFEPFSFNKDKYFSSIYVYKNGEKVTTSNLNDPKYEYFYQDWYQIPAKLGEPVWSEPYYDEGGGNTLMTTYSVPFYKIENGLSKLWGIITIDVELHWLDKLVSSIKIYETGFAFVISYAGTFVTHPNNEFIMNHTIFSLSEEHNIPLLRDYGRKMIDRQSGFEKLNGVTIKDDSRIYYTPFNSNNWSLGIIFPDKELYADLNNLSLIIVIIGFLGLIFIIVTITTVSKKMTKPLNLFAIAANEIGSGKFNSKLPEINSKDEIEELFNSFKQMQFELNNYIINLKETTAEKEKMQSELRIAHKIQMDMVPKIFPPFPERDDVDLFAILDSAKEVGGDLYDFFFIDDEKIVVLVGDVAGKGVPASLFMAVTRTLIRSKITKGITSSVIIDQINRDLMQNNDSQLFVTLLLCIIDLKTKTMEFTSAGHNPAYIVSNSGEITPLKDRHGMALGLFDLKPYTSSFYQMKQGDKFILYTDGVNEAMDKDGNIYDYYRLENMLGKIQNLTAKESTELIIKDIINFANGAEQSDDITLMVVTLK
ncbi:MAG: SpoIIE family protein phosphatase [Bacteroidetes bacterium]|nr:SpoIIE family protein phosphatase [Bacteroidota bacterium]MBU1115424.1 SpoIIE family protein phosphatase [Bacteroidota bacterium]MBU1797945.1 SpoIIE family protein phosphatase [Bacteroidota bacterium]